VRRNRTGSPGGEAKTAIKIERGRPVGLVKKLNQHNYLKKNKG